MRNPGISGVSPGKMCFHFKILFYDSENNVKIRSTDVKIIAGNYRSPLLASYSTNQNKDIVGTLFETFKFYIPYFLLSNMRDFEGLVSAGSSVLIKFDENSPISNENLCFCKITFTISVFITRRSYVERFPTKINHAFSVFFLLESVKCKIFQNGGYL